VSSALCRVSVWPVAALTQPGEKVEFWMSTVVVAVGASQVADPELHPATVTEAAMRATATKRWRIAQKGSDRPAP